MIHKRISLLGAFALGAMALAACRPASAQLTFTYTSFDPPGIDQPFLSGISNTGVLVGGYGSAAPYQGLLYQNGVATTVSYPNAIGNSETDLNSINSAGIATGDYIDFNANTAKWFLYDSNAHTFSTPVHPSTLNPTDLALAGINDAGLVAGNYLDSNNIRHSTIYNIATQTFTDLPDVSAFGNYAQDVAPNGDVLVNYATDANVHFSGSLYSNGAYTTLNFPGAVSTHLDAINASGLILGNYSLDDNELSQDIRHGLVYQSGTFYSLDFPGASGTYLGYGLNNANQIAGYYIDSVGSYHGLLVTITPEPGSVALLTGMVISGGLMLRRARKRRVS